MRRPGWGSVGAVSSRPPLHFCAGAAGQAGQTSKILPITSKARNACAAELRPPNKPALLAGVSEITQILEAARDGDPRATADLLPLVYKELRRLAAAKMSSQPPGQTLQATALVHEAYLRLLGNSQKEWQDRRHFFAAAAEAMRHILVDRARSKAAIRHGGGLARLNLDNVSIASETSDENVLRVNDALEKLTIQDPGTAELVRLRFFAGFSFAEAAELLGISERTAMRRWSYARAWLFEEINSSG